MPNPVFPDPNSNQPLTDSVILGTEQGKYPYVGTLSDRLNFLVRYATGNCRTNSTGHICFLVGESFVDVATTSSFVAGKHDPIDHVISAGTKVDHFMRAMKAHLLEPELEPFPDSERTGFLARIHCRGDYRPTAEELRNFNRIAISPPTGGREHNAAINDKEFRELSLAATEYGVRLRWVKELGSDLDSTPSNPPDEIICPQHLGVLYTISDDPKSWLEAGRAQSAVLILAEDQGVPGSIVDPSEALVLRRKFSVCTGPFHFAQAIVRVNSTMPWQSTPESYGAVPANKASHTKAFFGRRTSANH